MKSSSLWVLALSAAVFTSKMGGAEPRVIIDKEKAAAPTQSATKGRAEADSTHQDGALTEVPSDIQSVEGLRKWLKKFPEEKVVIKLGATWCKPCSQLHPVIEGFAKENAGAVKVITIDVDNNQALAQALTGGSKVPAIVTLKNDSESKPSAPIVGYIPGGSSKIGDWLKRNSGKINHGDWL
ncbi:MAG: thioredoxin [Proteobacteria bacterium]|nr:thioredoxin [Pseudomonadota bacterium]NDC25036.1 thioredoxin [Pseudomonadota bacterium]NDD04907.1 thioredoxin [Pseudomonadota bacterium]NDG26302.1 thioredoxin [Pseudomonadota bacterium]